MDSAHVETPVSNMQQLRLQESELTSSSRQLARASSFSVIASSSSSSSAFSDVSSGRSASFGDAAWFSEDIQGRWVDDDTVKHRFVSRAAFATKSANHKEPAMRNPRNSVHQTVPVMATIAPNDDWSLLARARLLAVAFNIVNSIDRVTEIVVPGGELQRVFKLGTMSPRDPSFRPDSSHCQQSIGLGDRFEAFMNVLVSVAQALFHDDFLLQARDRMQDLARQNAPIEAAYEHALILVEHRVDEATTSCLENCQHASLHDDGQPHCRALAALFRSYENEIQAAPRWQDGSWLYSGEPDQSNKQLPYLAFFRDYYDAVCASIMFSPLSIPPPSASATGLSGVWRLVNADRDIATAASHDAGHPAYPFSWFQQQLQGFISQVYCIVETETKMTLTLGNSLVSSACPFFAELDHREPLIEVPRDHFPYGCDRQNLLVAYKARRLRSILDKSGSCVSVCSMRWPSARVDTRHRRVEPRSPHWSALNSDFEDGDEDDQEDVDVENVEMNNVDSPPRRLLRTRMTSTFSLLSPTRLQVNTIIEGSWTEDSKLCEMMTTPPNTADMIKYYNAPGTWELMAKLAMQFDRTSQS
ncbi:hypothetical protein ATCC90586_005413 [Pythium insidiosum]|nr:hypothetical protein ATCC90586_005413 [Pythium insidiosum]